MVDIEAGFVGVMKMVPTAARASNFFFCQEIERWAQELPSFLNPRTDPQARATKFEPEEWDKVVAV